jgi:virginiamycin B lyase
LRICQENGKMARREGRAAMGRWAMERRGAVMRITRHAAGLAVVVAGLLSPSVATAAIKTYNVGANPGRMARAADGSMWFTKTGAVGRITPSGVARSFGLPGAKDKDVLAVTVAVDGSAWAAEAPGSIARIDGTGKVTEFAPAVLGMPAGIVAGPDGQVWFSDAVLGKITRFDRAGGFVDMVLGNVRGPYSRLDPAAPTEMVVGPDQAVWILQLAPGRVGRMSSDGSVSYYWLPEGAASAPTGLAFDRDGALWVAEAGVNRVARMALDGSVREYGIPSPGAEPRAIAVGPDGAMWFTEFGRDRIGRIDGTGAVTEYELPSGSMPYGIVGGADGAIWVTLWGKGGQVARVTTDTPIAARAARRTTTKKRAHTRRTARQRRHR